MYVIKCVLKHILGMWLPKSNLNTRTIYSTGKSPILTKYAHMWVYMHKELLKALAWERSPLVTAQTCQCSHTQWNQISGQIHPTELQEWYLLGAGVDWYREAVPGNSTGSHSHWTCSLSPSSFHKPCPCTFHSHRISYVTSSFGILVWYYRNNGI